MAPGEFTNAHPALAGFWHPAALSNDLGSEPVAVTLLGKGWVLARFGGVISAFADECPHRRARWSAGVLAGAPSLSLVSDAVVAGDVQLLGDGTPIVLMRDHQPTGGYPRIATVISADLDRLANALAAAGIPANLDHDPLGPAVLCVRDPDNIALEFFEEP